MSEHPDGARRLSRWAGIGIAACAVGFALFYLGLFRRDNAAPAIDLAGIAPAPAGQFFHHLDHCRVTARTLVVRGWAVRKGHSWPLTHSRVVLRLADGRAVGLDTAWLEQQPALARAIHARTGDQVVYYAPRFAASLNTSVAGIDPAGARLLLLWEQGPVRALLPLDCPGLAR